MASLKERFSLQRLTNNWGLKLISLVTAVIMWMIVVNINDPIVAQTYKNVQVRFINEQVVTGNGKTIQIENDSDVINTITVRAQRSVIRELGNSNDYIMAVADFSNLSKDGTVVPIEISTTKYPDKIDSIRASDTTLSVKIEDRKEIQLPILAKATGDLESGYILGNITTAQNQVRISGPESIVSEIASANVEIPVTGFSENITSIADIVLRDNEGTEVPTDDLNMNVSSISVDVEILATKRLPIFFSTMGEAPDGYGVTGEILCDPETIVVAGTKETIADLTEIDIPSSELNITGYSNDLTVVVDVKKYLPQGTRLADSNFSGNVSITVYIEPYEEENYAIYLNKIEIKNVPAGFKANFPKKNDVVEFTLKGLKQNFEKVQLSSLDYKVDFDDYLLVNNVKEFKEGSYELPLVLELPDGIRCDDVIYVTVELTEE
ncbi:MAG: hypothetical protein J6U37_00590 [Lachnospiraceae bacterium]|nr:hypothetical protein [Lachnospiraceae bacterium]